MFKGQLLRSGSFALLLTLTGLSAFGQGDTCTTALPVTTGIYFADGPTSGYAGLDCGSGNDGDWYKYTAPFSGTVKITSCHPLNNSTSYDTFLKVFSGSCDSLSCIGFNDDMGQSAQSCQFNPFASYMEVNVTAGQDYFIVWTNTFSSIAFYWELSECAGTVVGETYLDANSNGLRDNSENHVSTMLEINPGGHFAYSGNDPYSFCSDFGSYTITLPNPPLYHTAIPTSRSYTIANLGDQITGMDFALQPIPGIFDVGVHLWGWNPWIGNNTTLQVRYSNPGTEAVPATIVLSLDPLISFVEASLAPSSISGQNVNWDLGLLPVGASGTISVTIYTSSSAAPNAPVHNSVSITTGESDINPANNTDALNGIATTSYDPNDKQVDQLTLTPDEVLDRKPLEYTVRFQNTGTAPAVNVVIKDSLDIDWDLSTFEMIGATHPFSMTLTNEVMIWTFANILLPDSSTDAMGSQGSLHYRITPKADLILGDQLTNRADIYFDYNEPVLTNVTVTTVALRTGIAESTANGGLSIYPSPSTGIITLRAIDAEFSNARFTVVDGMGREVFTTNISGPIGVAGRPIDLNTLAIGSYVARLQSEGRDVRTRFVINR